MEGRVYVYKPSLFVDLLTYFAITFERIRLFQQVWVYLKEDPAFLSLNSNN